MTAALSLSSVGKIYQAKSGPVEALDGIDFNIGDGEFLSILGPSGCGKSTLLSLASGLEFPTSGTVALAGKRIDRAVTDIGIVFQTDVLLEWRRVLGNVLIQPQIRGLDMKLHEQKARDLLALVGLAGFEDKYPHELSGGMRQRVSICRSLIHDPPLLLMDEPFGALDEMTREYLQSELARIAVETGAAVVFVTHSIPEAVFLSDRVVVMSPRPGRITDVIVTDLGEDRDEALRESPEYFARVTAVREALHGAPVERANER